MCRSLKGMPVTTKPFCFAAILAATFGTASFAQAQSQTLTLYSAQHEQVVDMLTAEFTQETGIKVLVHTGEGPDVANQILQEGVDSPADVFFTENSPELNLLDEKSLLAPVSPATLAEIPAKYNAADGDWLGILARENVLDYNPSSLIPETALPGFPAGPRQAAMGRQARHRAIGCRLPAAGQRRHQAIRQGRRAGLAEGAEGQFQNLPG
jgi:hypothetical protein